MPLWGYAVLSSEIMLFGALFSSYMLMRVGAAYWPAGAVCSYPHCTLNTVLLSLPASPGICLASLKRGFRQIRICWALSILAAGILGVKGR